jgi:hypothetical protein
LESTIVYLIDYSLPHTTSRFSTGYLFDKTEEEVKVLFRLMQKYPGKYPFEIPVGTPGREELMKIFGLYLHIPVQIVLKRVTIIQEEIPVL